MKLSPLAMLAQVSLLAVLTSTGCSRSETPAENHHDVHAYDAHDSDHSESLMPPAGKRWATDEPLRAAMTRLRATVKEALPAHESGVLDAATAQALAQTVEREVTFMIENCKLAPEPDAALHVLIARMMSAATGLKKTPADTAAITELARVLDDYGASFDHPEWAPLHQHG